MIDIALLKSERGLLVGMTGTGKSTLGTDLIWRFRRLYPGSLVLIIDSKPRFRAQYRQDGMEVRYKNWVEGDYFPGSVALTRPVPLKEARKFGSIFIYQSTDEKGNIIIGYEDGVDILAQDLFRLSNPKNAPTLIFFDEFYDVLNGGLAAIASKPVLKTIRAGREKGMAVLMGAQRPRSIPVPALSEVTKFYVFRLEFVEDLKYMTKHGIPAIGQPHDEHGFIFADKKRRIEQECVLGGIAA